MRMDTPVFFQRIQPGAYDPNTGNYGADSIVEQERFASVTSTGINTLHLVYGEVKQGSLTVRLQTRYAEPFDRIRIGEKFYRVDMERPLRTKHVFVVSEVQQNGADQN